MRVDNTVSLIISTYNNPDFLELTLMSVLAQTVLPGEVIIADDGSTEETYKLISHYKEEFPVSLIHVWQPDEGFQLSKIRNIAAAVASKQYIVQTDGDVILEKHFIQDHLFHRKPKTILQGSRIFVSQVKTAQLVKDKNINISFFSRGIRERFKILRNTFLSNFLSEKKITKLPLYYARGCNMSYYKEDFIEVNGYDMDFTGWGHEDSEFTLRMLNNGCAKKYLKFNGILFHLFHLEAPREKEQDNKIRMEENFSAGIRRCKNGIDRFLMDAVRYIKH